MEIREAAEIRFAVAASANRIVTPNEVVNLIVFLVPDG